MITVKNQTSIYDMIKCTISVLVVVAHVTRMYTPYGAVPVSNSSLVLNYVNEYMSVFFMPLFIFVAGAVYGYCIKQGKYTNKRKFIIDKCKRLMIPYIVFGTFLVTPIMCKLNITPLGLRAFWTQGIALSLDARHLWYLWALFWIFILAMILKPIWQKGIAGGVVVAAISICLFVFFHRMPVKFQIGNACMYQIYFFTGILFNHYYKRISPIMYKCRGIFAVLPFVMLLLLINNPNKYTNAGYAFMGIAMVVGLCHWLLRAKPQIVETKLHKSLLRDSFGLYLFHPMIVYVCFWAWGQYDITPWILTVGITVISIIISIIATNVLRKVHLEVVIGEKCKYRVGEKNV